MEYRREGRLEVVENVAVIAGGGGWRGWEEGRRRKTLVGKRWYTRKDERCEEEERR